MAKPVRSTPGDESSKRMKNMFILALILGTALPVIIQLIDYIQSHYSYQSIQFLYPHDPDLQYTDPTHYTAFKSIFYSGSPHAIFCLNATHYQQYQSGNYELPAFTYQSKKNTKPNKDGDISIYDFPAFLSTFASLDRRNYFSSSSSEFADTVDIAVLDCFKPLEKTGQSLIQRFGLNIPAHFTRRRDNESDPWNSPFLMSSIPVLFTANVEKPQFFLQPSYEPRKLLKAIQRRLQPDWRRIASSSSLLTQCYQKPHCVLMLYSKTAVQASKSTKAIASGPFSLTPNQNSSLTRLQHEFRSVSFAALNLDLYEYSIERKLPGLEGPGMDDDEPDYPRILVFKREKIEPLNGDNGDKPQYKNYLKVYRSGIDYAGLRGFLSSIVNGEMKMAELNGQSMPSMRSRGSAKFNPKAGAGSSAGAGSESKSSSSSTGSSSKPKEEKKKSEPVNRAKESDRRQRESMKGQAKQQREKTQAERGNGGRDDGSGIEYGQDVREVSESELEAQRAEEAGAEAADNEEYIDLDDEL